MTKRKQKWAADITGVHNFHAYVVTRNGTAYLARSHEEALAAAKHMEGRNQRAIQDFVWKGQA